MELVVLGACLNTFLPRLWEMRKVTKQRKENIERNIRDLHRRITLLEAALEDAKFKTGAHVTALKQQARELTQETLDCVQRFIKNKGARSTEFETKTQKYEKDLKDLCEQLCSDSSGETAREKPEEPFVDVANPTGIDGPRDELLALVGLPDKPSEGRRKVISIVGFAGLGKTLLAKMVYDKDCKDRNRTTPVQESSSSSTSTAKNLFKLFCDKTRTALVPDSTPDRTLRARVTAAAKKASEVLREILKEVDTEGNHENHNLEKLGQVLEGHLQGKRYFIVIDDMQSSEQWSAMNDAFPKDGNGTIIVTTTIQSVAKVCSSCNGYVYKLSPLDKDKSLDLFLRDRPWNRGLVENCAENILTKCDGLPLAIVSMSQILQGLGVPPGDAWKDDCITLGEDLVKEGKNLTRLRWALMNKYTGLNGYALRCCLLYFCMYKHNMQGAVLRRNSLMRRWEAEGFLVPTNGVNPPPMDVGAKNLETLVDRNIIQSMEVGTDGAARRCRLPGMMLEYISQISKSENFAALVSNVQEPNGIRRLYFRDGNDNDGNDNDVRKMSKVKLKLVLTMAVSGEGCDAVLKFKEYELIAVLDLKECTNLKHSHVRDICKLLVLLKYLSLGDSIDKIPEEIENLVLLVTLEMRTSKTVKMHKNVLKLRYLKHLIGNFRLGRTPDDALYKFLKNESVLETVTGFVTKTAEGFPDLMLHMLSLRKVKIVCNPDASVSDLKRLPEAIKAFTAEGINVVDKRSLSIDLTEFPAGGEGLESPLEFLQADPAYLGSLKLRGDRRTSLGANSQFTTISGITKLCLSRTTLSGDEILAGLTNLTALQYLKLDKQEFGALLIKSGILQSLTRLCLVGGTIHDSITIEHDGLPALVSLQLICEARIFKVEKSQVEDNQVQPPNIAEPQIIAVELPNGCLRGLQEIALHSRVDPDMHEAWKNAAKGHPNRPGVLKNE